jgi:hypothetical protein
MEGDIHQPAVTICPHARHTCDRRWIDDTVAHEPEPTWPFRDQHRPIRQERNAPWMREPPGDNPYANLGLFGGVEHKRSVTKRRNWHTNLLLLRIANASHADQ